MVKFDIGQHVCGGIEFILKLHAPLSNISVYYSLINTTQIEIWLP